MKKNIVIVILSVVILGLGGYLVYDKVIDKDEKSISNEEIKEGQQEKKYEVFNDLYNEIKNSSGEEKCKPGTCYSEPHNSKEWFYNGYIFGFINEEGIFKFYYIGNNLDEKISAAKELKTIGVEDNIVSIVARRSPEAGKSLVVVLTEIGKVYVSKIFDWEKHMNSDLKALEFIEMESDFKVYGINYDLMIYNSTGIPYAIDVEMNWATGYVESAKLGPSWYDLYNAYYAPKN